MAAVMVLLCQVVEDLGCNLDGKYLLVNKLYFRKVTAGTAEDGVYLYYNKNSSTWVRAGMVSLRNLHKRGVEHKNGFKQLLPGMSPTLGMKQNRAIHYMCEMAYGLSLAEKDNVFRSPDWEQALKVYGN
jgi:hypothetical protein